LSRTDLLGNVVVFISDGLGNRTFDVPAEAVTQSQQVPIDPNDTNCQNNPHPAP